MAATQNITVFRAEDILLNVTMDPIEDVTGWTIVFTLRQTRTTVVLDSISGSITDGPGGTFSFVIPSASTNITAGNYIYDIVRIDPGADKVLTTGVFTIKSGVRTP